MENKSFDLLAQQGIVEEIVNNESTSSFFILNNTDRPDRRTGKSTKDAATMYITVTSGGQSRMVRIPVSWVPIDASQQASKQEIASSAEFRRMFASQMIIVLKDDEARRIINTDQDSRDEYARVMALAQGVNGADDAYDNGRETNLTNDPWANVGQEVKLNVDVVLSEAMSLSEFRSWMRRNERNISSLDRSYIADKLPDLAA